MHTTPSKIASNSGIMSAEHAVLMNALYEEAHSGNTKRTYQKQFGYFVQWCTDHGLPFDPSKDVVTPEHLAVHITDLFKQGSRLDTIKARVRAVAAFHKIQQEHRSKQGVERMPSPTGDHKVTKLLQGMRNTIAKQVQAGDARQGKKKALCMWSDDLFRCAATINSDTIEGKRNLAVLLVGWAGGFRRSELVSVKVEHLEWKRTNEFDGIVITLHSTKTKKKVTKQIRREPASAPWCPVRALEAWLAVADVKAGFVFRSFNMLGMSKTKPLAITDKGLPDKCVDLLVKKLAKDASLAEGKWSAHSLRRGYISQHLAWGVEEQAVRRQAGFTPSSPVFFEYVEEARDHAETRSSLYAPGRHLYAT